MSTNLALHLLVNVLVNRFKSSNRLKKVSWERRARWKYHYSRRTMDNSKVCKHKSHQRTNTNSQKSKQSESVQVFIQISMDLWPSPCFYCFATFFHFFKFSPPTGSLKSKDSGLSPEPSYDKYPSESGEFLVSTTLWSNRSEWLIAYMKGPRRRR